MQLWQKFWEILFWASLPFSFFLLWRILSMEKRASKLKKQIQRDLHSPGMEESRQFLKPLMKKHGIETDDQHHERN